MNFLLESETKETPDDDAEYLLEVSVRLEPLLVNESGAIQLKEVNKHT